MERGRGTEHWRDSKPAHCTHLPIPAVDVRPVIEQRLCKVFNTMGRGRGSQGHHERAKSG